MNELIIDTIVDSQNNKSYIIKCPVCIRLVSFKEQDILVSCSHCSNDISYYVKQIQESLKVGKDVENDYGCFDCDIKDCENYGHDVDPIPYCPSSPIRDYYRKEIKLDKFPCKDCVHRSINTRYKRCSRCKHGQT